MKIALTGATGFLGRYVAKRLAAAGHQLQAWKRPSSDVSDYPVEPSSITWIEGSLQDPDADAPLLKGCDAVVHAALDHEPGKFQGGDGPDLLRFLERNILGTIRLIEAARANNVARFVFVSTCAVHDEVLADRPLDETHPLWPKTHYGAHKAAIEAFVSSYGRGQGYPICALRPTGIYGLAHPWTASKWARLIASVARGKIVSCKGGGKEVHADDVAKSIEILLKAPESAYRGNAYSCCDRPISQEEVAQTAKKLSGSEAEIVDDGPYAPKNAIVTTKLQSLGMTFGGLPLLEKTIGEILEASRKV